MNRTYLNIRDKWRTLGSNNYSSRLTGRWKLRELVLLIKKL